jgi:ATP synthase protein I
MGSPDDKDLSARYKDLDQRLARAKDDRNGKHAGSRGSAMGVAFRIATDLVAAIAVGVGIGWLLDSWLETKPLFLLVFFLIGVAAGIMNVIRVANRLNEQDKARTGASKDGPGKSG